MISSVFKNKDNNKQDTISRTAISRTAISRATINIIIYFYRPHVYSMGSDAIGISGQIVQEEN